ncbi:MAG: hypothetical protein JSV25_11945 [Spirochaetota bacterium]|nr:MAG: hypothetical protein JSV25_11945 [Spirochaetota bacterium]
MKIKKIYFMFLMLLLLGQTAYAHRPVIVKNNSSKQNPVLVERPEISWAYYGELDDKSHYYRIVSEVPFNLYVNILVPDTDPEGRLIETHDMSFQIFKNDTMIYTAEGKRSQWKRFYEEYGKDHYYMGAEYDQNAEAGEYIVRVYNSANRGKYSLAIGKIEKFTLVSLIDAIAKAQSLDEWFFK